MNAMQLAMQNAGIKAVVYDFECVSPAVWERKMYDSHWAAVDEAGYYEWPFFHSAPGDVEYELFKAHYYSSK